MLVLTPACHLFSRNQWGGLGCAVASTAREETRPEHCPISDCAYTETGAEQPVFLPDCGHTFSRGTVVSLFRTQRARARSRTHIRCPLCNTNQVTLVAAEDCVPNWDAIQRLQPQIRCTRKAARASTSPRQYRQEVEGQPKAAKVRTILRASSERGLLVARALDSKDEVSAFKPHDY